VNKITCLIIFVFNLCYCSLPVIAQNTEQELLAKIEANLDKPTNPQTAEYFNKLGFYYWENGRLLEAIEAVDRAENINKEIGNENALKGIYSNMGMIYLDMGQPETALVYFRKGLLISRSMAKKQDIGTTLLNIASTLELLERNEEALENLNEALPLLLEINNINLISSCYSNLAHLNQKIGNAEKSIEYFNLYSSLHKSIQQKEVEQEKQKSREQVAESERKAKQAMKEKKMTEEKLEVTKDSLKIAETINEQNRMKLALQDAQLKSQRLLILIFVIVTVFLAIMALFISWSLRQKKKHNEILAHRNEEIRLQNEKIKEKNKKINQSINYARNIQGALLPGLEILEELFPESFVFFSPRDIVSGDFYWFEKYNYQGTNLSVVAAVDCTGHGVPGAFMSMLGLSFLDEIIMDKGIIDPAEVLENMHQLVRTDLKQQSSGNTDGMDMALCVYNPKSGILKFAGAANTLIYIQDGQLLSIRGEFFGIGGSMKEAAGPKAKFTTYELEINKPTVFYIFSDGFVDQFGGSEGRKFFTKNFRNLLLDIHHLPMMEQKEILESTLKHWLGDKYQRVDDILIIGFKVQ